MFLSIFIFHFHFIVASESIISDSISSALDWDLKCKEELYHCIEEKFDYCLKSCAGMMKNFVTMCASPVTTDDIFNCHSECSISHSIQCFSAFGYNLSRFNNSTSDESVNDTTSFALQCPLKNGFWNDFALGTTNEGHSSQYPYGAPLLVKPRDSTSQRRKMIKQIIGKGGRFQIPGFNEGGKYQFY
ncbi:uncharacterized protein MONOS_18551 [Monocercomonoides exilis]|uniref:uncharacterized protein n=1 Tax=Monocercomonoides exilis TaxID=2049356 RepID=UPI0035596A4C|nr:hypothetical protein MONOS_18551 [Monocercomonoides exilis]